MALVVTVCSTIAWLIGGDVLVRLGEQVLGAATFSYNWVSIAGDAGYFGSAAPELFRNFWSLSVEEQFYVLWPLILPLFLLLPRRGARAAVAMGLAVASAGWMAAVVWTGGDVTRAYFGTDTHSFGILLGVALAFVLDELLDRPARDDAPAPIPAVTPPAGWTIVMPPSVTRTATATRAAWVGSRAARTVTGSLGIASLAGIAVCASLPAGDGAATFPGSLLAASLFTALAITAGVWPGSWFGPALDARPLRWVGDRSYGIYLWHWPLLVLAAAAVPVASGNVPVWIGLGVLALTLIAAEASYRFVETPVRRLGFVAALRRLRDLVRADSRGRLRALGVVTAGVLVLGGTSAAIAAAPSESSGESAVAAGQAALDRARRSAGPAATPAPALTPAAASSSPAAATPAPAPTGGPLTTKPSPMPQPTPVTGAEISAVGDSVMLASVPALFERLPGIQVDAEVSRSAWAGPGLLEGLASRESCATTSWWRSARTAPSTRTRSRAWRRSRGPTGT
nr:hypothetical protein GCM10025699_03160 [Microbacterium flavescens]